MATLLKVGDRVRLMAHETAPHQVGRLFTIYEVYAPSTMFGITRNCVMLENSKMWLRAEVENVELVD